MKNAPEQARRWLAQAEYNLRVARSLSAEGLWSSACFMAEQTAQVVLKAYLYGQGRRSIPIHSVYELARECANLDSAFEPLLGGGQVLDRYYLITRYPDALPPPAVPYQVFSEAEARQALAIAEQAVALVRDRVSPEA